MACGGRGEVGGVKLCRTEEVRVFAADLLGTQLVTRQTGAARRGVYRLWVEQASDIARELSLGFVLDRQSERIMIVASGHGGVEMRNWQTRTPRACAAR